MDDGFYHAVACCDKRFAPSSLDVDQWASPLMLPLEEASRRRWDPDAFEPLLELARVEKQVTPILQSHQKCGYKTDDHQKTIINPMAVLFRRIKVKFLTKGKLKKYLIYAIVEVLLIVIGILLALTLNTWQNNTKNRSIEKDYISDLIIDLRQDTSYFNVRRMKNIKKKAEALNQAKAYLLGTYQIKDTLLFLNTVGYGARYSRVVATSNNSTYTELVSTGNLRIIENREIRKEIINYYGSKDAATKTIQGSKTGYLDYINSLRSFKKEAPNQISRSDQRRMLRKLKEDSFYGLINQELTFADGLEIHFKKGLENGKRLIQTLQAYRNEIK